MLLYTKKNKKVIELVKRILKIFPGLVVFKIVFEFCDVLKKKTLKTLKSLRRLRKLSRFSHIGGTGENNKSVIEYLFFSKSKFRPYD